MDTIATNNLSFAIFSIIDIITTGVLIPGTYAWVRNHWVLLSLIVSLPQFTYKIANNSQIDLHLNVLYWLFKFYDDQNSYMIKSKISSLYKFIILIIFIFLFPIPFQAIKWLIMTMTSATMILQVWIIKALFFFSFKWSWISDISGTTRIAKFYEFWYEQFIERIDEFSRFKICEFLLEIE